MENFLCKIYEKLKTPSFTYKRNLLQST